MYHLRLFEPVLRAQHHTSNETQCGTPSDVVSADSVVAVAAGHWCSATGDNTKAAPHTPGGGGTKKVVGVAAGSDHSLAVTGMLLEH